MLRKPRAGPKRPLSNTAPYGQTPRIHRELLMLVVKIAQFTRGVRTSDADSGPAIIMLQDFCVSLALIGHDCRADLA